MTDPIRDQLVSEINEMLKWIRDIEDSCVFNRSCPTPSDGIERIPHPEILAGHAYLREVVVPASEFMVTKWLMISPPIRTKMRDSTFKDTLKNFKVHYDAYLFAISSKPKPLLFDKSAATKVIRTSVRKERVAEGRKPKPPQPTKPPQPRLMEGFGEACNVARFRRNLEDQEHGRKHRPRKPRATEGIHPSGDEGSPGGKHLPQADLGGDVPETGTDSR